MTAPNPEPEPRHVRALWIGAGGAVVAALLGVFGPHDGSVWRTPAVLQERVETALHLIGAPGVAVEMRGQEALLHGVLGEAEAVEAAMNAALRAAGPGGAWAGGVTGVDISDLRVGPAAAPFTWRVRKQGREVVLSGSAPSEHAREELLAAAAAAFPNAEAPVDEMNLAGGAPSADWLDVAREAIVQLGVLGSGEARFSGDHIVLIGEGTAETAALLRAHYENAPASYDVRVDVAVAGAAGPLHGLEFGAGDAEACEQAFARLMSQNVIQFETGSAAIDSSSQALLDTLASVALRCDRFSIQAAGHTDNLGARAVNMELSRRRAEAVTAYLAAQGVAADRLSAVGFGADRPVASNATEAGRGANRRIEFDVSG
jgi:OOP family OmpA-OmpF porin